MTLAPRIDTIEASFRKKNLIHNPSFDIWQRGPGPFINTGFTTDRFSITTGRSLEAEPSADVPSWTASQNSVKLTNTTFVAAPGNYTTRFTHRIEGYNIRSVKGKNMILSFNVKGNFSGQSSIGIFNGAGANYSIVLPYNITTNWTRVNIVIPADNFDAAAWDFTNGTGLDISWTLSKSSNYNTSNTGVWQSGLFFGHADDYDFNANAGDWVLISDVSLTEGDVEIPFEYLRRDITQEMELCQRYFERLDSVWANIGGANYLGANKKFNVAKRDIPVLSGVSVSSGIGVTPSADIYGAYISTGFGPGFLYVSGGVADAELP